MIAYIIAVILAVLIVITILHDISIFRLARKVDMLQTFIDVTLRSLTDYALKQKSNADQHTQDVGSVEQNCRRCTFYATDRCKGCFDYEYFTDSGYITELSKQTERSE